MTGNRAFWVICGDISGVWHKYTWNTKARQELTTLFSGVWQELKGVFIMNTVEPIRDKNLIDRIQTELEKEKDWHGKRIYLLFMTGIYTGLRISDLVRLQVRHVNSGDKIRLKETKTGKKTVIKINQILRIIFDERLNGMKESDYLFPSRQADRKGNKKPITTHTAEADMKIIADRFGITFPFNCHSLRKTFGYWHYRQWGDIETLRQTFNHSTQAVTRRYIGIDEEERNRKVEGLRIGTYKPERKTAAKKRSHQVNTPLETHYHDRTKQGKILGQRMKEKAKKKGSLTAEER